MVPAPECLGSSRRWEKDVLGGRVIHNYVLGNHVTIEDPKDLPGNVSEKDRSFLSHSLLFPSSCRAIP